jgi:predicted flap endonuclease-1-like 5' DNA nuclease
MMLAPKKNETPFAYWISFWPTAPMFGVKWRFEGMVPPMFPPAAMMGEAARAAAAEAAEAIETTMNAGADAMIGAATIIVDEATPYVEAVEDAAHDAAAVGEAVAESVAAAAEDAAVAAADATAESADAVETAAEEIEAAADEMTAAAMTAPAVLFDQRPDEIDDLKQIKGVGPKLETMLNAMGIYRLDQIAGFSPENLAWVDSNLTAFKGRPLRDDWVAQARGLLSGSRQLL